MLDIVLALGMLLTLPMTLQRPMGRFICLGTIVHNERVIDDLSEAGAKVVNSIDDVPKDKPLFRAHGTSPELWDRQKKII